MTQGPAPDLQQRVAELQCRLAEAQQALDAIRRGDVDALVVRGAGSDEVYTRDGAERPYRLLVEAMNEGAAILSPGGWILYANQRLAAMLGVPLERLIGAPLCELVPDADRERLEASLAEGGETSARMELRLGGAARPVQTVQISLRRLGVPDRDELSLVVTDVSDRKRNEEAFARAALQLARSNTELEHFAAVASHDLKAPLRAIDHLSQWIEEDAGPLLPEASREHLGTLRGRIRRMTALLDDLLCYARAGGAVAPEPIALRELLEDVVQLAAPPAGFRVSIACEVATLRAPRAPLEQALRNLVDNAIKHHDRAEGRIELEVRAVERGVEIAVADDGPGIPAHCHDRVFRLFQTLRPRRDASEGGIGLALVKKLVEANDGTVRIEPREGRGVRFVVSWPEAQR